MRLPVVGSRSPEPGGTSSVPEVGTRPDPERIAEGWEHRFVATGDRVEEMVTLYRELGFEVVTDPVHREGMDEGCLTCFSGGLEYRAIYTRRRKRPDHRSTEGG
ncbi:MAG: hypothetical protein JSU98_15645 [Gemmatimonadales bacterium]|nr:MAG: hypothetical protein JSU98_15645 [Gemmatimonadales bacterium]